ncbi:hypothetical protein ACGFIU_17675 [Rhodococcus oryzae]
MVPWRGLLEVVGHQPDHQLAQSSWFMCMAIEAASGLDFGKLIIKVA